MFNASKSYGSAFDNDIWKPEGMPDAVGSDQGLDSFVSDPLKAHEAETRFAGDALMAYTDTVNARETMDAEIDAAKSRADYQAKMRKQQSGGGFGQALGLVGKALPMLGGLFCDMRLKKDVTPLHCTGEVNDQLAAMALSVHHLRDVCS